MLPVPVPGRAGTELALELGWNSCSRQELCDSQSPGRAILINCSEL